MEKVFRGPLRGVFFGITAAAAAAAAFLLKRVSIEYRFFFAASRALGRAFFAFAVFVAFCSRTLHSLFH